MHNHASVLITVCYKKCMNLKYAHVRVYVSAAVQSITRSARQFPTRPRLQQTLI